MGIVGLGLKNKIQFKKIVLFAGADEVSLPWEGDRGRMISVDISLGDIYSLKTAIERLLFANIWVLVLWGTQKMQEKKGICASFLPEMLECYFILSFSLLVFLVLLNRWVLKQGWKDAELCLPTK